MMNEVARKFANEPTPMAATAASPRDPTIARSTRFRTFWETIPPMIGRARSKIRR